MNYEEWMAIAQKSINTQVKEGKPFEVKSLFKGYKWEELSRGEKISFGRYFLA